MEQQILSEINEVQYTIERSPKTGDHTLVFMNQDKKQYVLSKFDPKKSALSFIDKERGNKSTIWILLGFNFGYALEQLIMEVGEYVNVFVIEPNEQFLIQQLDIYSERTKRPLTDNIHFFAGTEFIEFRKELGEMLGEYEFNNFKIVSSPKHLEFYHEYFKNILNEIDECVNAKIINFNTVILGNANYIVNTVKNRHDIVQTCDMKKLAGKFKNIPAVIVSAGPSLDKNINELKNFNGIIFGMGRTLAPIKHAGAKADFAASVDASDVIYDTFGECKEYDVPLITLGQSNPDVVKGCKAEKYFLYNSSELIAFTGARVNPVLDLSGSVATLCLSSAQYLGCSPIIFIGQDLAYTGNKAYASQSNVKPGAKIEDNPDLKIIKDFYGSEVCSDISMIAFLRWIEAFIYSHPESEYINCTEGGAFIEGCKHMPFSEAIAKYNPSKKVVIEHERIAENKNINVDDFFRSAVEQLKEIEKLLEQGADYYEEINELYQLPVLNKPLISILFGKIEEIDNKIAALSNSKNLLQMLMERVKIALASNNDYKETLNETEEQRRIRKLKLNCETYRYLAKEAKCILYFLRDEIEEG